MADKKEYDVEFDGIVYVRPCGRGLTIESSDDTDGWQVEDIFEEGRTYCISIKAKEIKRGD